MTPHPASELEREVIKWVRHVGTWVNDLNDDLLLYQLRTCSHMDWVRTAGAVAAYVLERERAVREECAAVCDKYALTEAHGGTLAAFIRAGAKS